MAEGDDACLLPWQREVIRRSCGEITASVRKRASQTTKMLTLVGNPWHQDSDFEVAREMAQQYIAENFSAGINNQADDNIKKEADAPDDNIQDVPNSGATPVQPEATPSKPPVQPKIPPPHIVKQQQQQLVDHQQQLLAQQQQLFQQCPSHPLAVQMHRQTMAMMTMTWNTIAQQNALGQPIPPHLVPMRVKPESDPDSPTVLRPAERGNK